MSTLSIAGYFPFKGVLILGQTVSDEVPWAVVKIVPDQRFRPRCHVCGRPAASIHSKGHGRLVQDLAMGAHNVWLQLSYRKVACLHCDRIRVEQLSFCEAGMRVTHRLAQYVTALCAILTVEEVARHVALDPKTVRALDKEALESQFGQTDYTGLSVLAVDEVAVKRGQQYMTVVLDYETGRVAWMGQGHTRQTMGSFFEGMTESQRRGIKAVAMDMWESYIFAVQKYCPHAKIVFDMFHVVKAYGKVVDTIRRAEFRRARDHDRGFIKGSRYLLLNNSEKLTPKEHHRLHILLQRNQTLATAYILKEQLKVIYRTQDRIQAWMALHSWIALAKQLRHAAMDPFIRMLKRHEDGILNHCDYPIGTSKLEGVINKIKVIKRKAYGFHDTRYFTLKVLQAFPGKN